MISPTGIAARNLGECLTLQLIEMGRLDAPMKVLIENIQRIAHHETKELCNLTGCDAIEIKRRLQVIRKLDPRPGDQFRNQSPSTKTPDIIVTANSQLGWHIEIATDNLPKILVNNLYIQEINDSGSGASKSMIEMSNQANWLVRSLDLRIKTLLKVATSIVRYQDGFFRLGIDGLRPMTLRTIASDLAMHESSISRATTGKYFACDRGIFELKSLFSRAISATENLTPHAAASVRNRVARIIATEISGKKLTDARIVEILKSEGVLIARRTVAKYRLAQRIPHSARRHFKLTVGNAN